MFPILSGNVASATAVSGNQEGIFGFGPTGGGYVGMTNLVTNAGVVGTDVTAVGTGRRYIGACSFGVAAP